ncbi:MAG: hypothetical protein RQ746_05430 [Bacteroidales bacterium]|nr:hypothetical protein [Bacteroidales bacterium]
MMKTNKEFDAVEMMRSIRDKHHMDYSLDPELREKRLAAIREKYKGRIRTNKPVKP